MNEQIEKSLTKIKARQTASALVIPETVTLDQWAEIGRFLLKSTKTMTWWIADWAAFGEKQYGRLKEFCDHNPDFEYGTVRNLAWVASNVELSRRRDNLKFSHHIEVASLPAKDQSKWLTKAEKENLSVVELRRQIRESTCLYPPEKTNGPSPDFIQVSRIFMEASDILDRKAAFIKSNSSEAYSFAEPLLKKAAGLWPDKVVLKK